MRFFVGGDVCRAAAGSQHRHRLLLPPGQSLPGRRRPPCFFSSLSPQSLKREDGATDAWKKGVFFADTEHLPDCSCRFGQAGLQRFFVLQPVCLPVLAHAPWVLGRAGWVGAPHRVVLVLRRSRTRYAPVLSEKSLSHRVSPACSFARTGIVRWISAAVRRQASSSVLQPPPAPPGHRPHRLYPGWYVLLL